MKKVNFFKRTVWFAVMAAVLVINASAQEKGDMAAGGGLVLGTGSSFTNFGIGAKFQYNVTDPLRLEGAFSYFLKKDYVTMWDLSVNAHWLFRVSDKMTAYPLAGLGILNSGASFDAGYGYGSVSSSTSNFGLNLGGGMDFKLTDKLCFNAELKYKIADVWNRLLLSAGVAYSF
jgi:outer membrane protein X